MDNEFNTIKKEGFKLYDPTFDPSKKLRLVTFRYLLPFRIPFVNGNTTIIDIEKNKVLFQFLHSTENDPIQDRVFVYNPLRRTIIEATVYLNRDDFKRLNKEIKNGYQNTSEISSHFDLQLKVLNTLIESIMLKFNFYNLYPLNKGELASVPFYKIYSFYNDTYSIINKGVFFIEYFKELEINENITFENGKFFHLNKYYEAYKKFPNKQSVLLLRNAQRKFDLCDYNSTIINAQTSIETLVKFIVKNYYILDESINEQKANNKVEKFKNSIREHLIPKVVYGLNLSYKQEIKNCLDKYYDKYYNFRNDIVHNGYNASGKEANEFLTITLDIQVLLNYGLNHTDTSPNFINFYKQHYLSSSNIPISDVANKYK